MKQLIKDEQGNEYTNRFARFLGKLNNEVGGMNQEAKAMTGNVMIKSDELKNKALRKETWKKVFSIFKRKK